MMAEAFSDPLAVIRNSVSDPEIFEKFDIFVKSAEEVDYERLFEDVDQTDYSLGDWVEAMVGFDAWLEAEDVNLRPFSEMVGYIHCCTMAAPQTISLANLKVIVIQSLTDFGFDAVSDPQL